ncbi:MAG: FMN-binding negative transcriptional regulator [Hyphomicrobiaceae bacterium]|nr:FMN-binding negative transcriptional regulator [Hyphomicrobiaceae bacterium]
MYTPEQFKVEDVAEMHALMRANPFATLVTHGPEGLIATHLPVVLKADGESPLGRLECHLARPNSHWRLFDPALEALLIFHGREAYIRPGWYPSKAETAKAVPTWNYEAVHAYGRIELQTGKDWLLRHVGELSEQQEAPFTERWSTSDAPESYMDVMLRGIVGLSLSLVRLEGKAKMSQNRELRDRAGVVSGLRARALGDDAAVAELVAASINKPRG